MFMEYVLGYLGYIYAISLGIAITYNLLYRFELIKYLDKINGLICYAISLASLGAIAYVENLTVIHPVIMYTICGILLSFVMMSLCVDKRTSKR